MEYPLLMTKAGDKETVQTINKEAEENEGHFFYLKREDTKSKGMLRGTQIQ